jgi:hypothetical protein
LATQFFQERLTTTKNEIKQTKTQLEAAKAEKEQALVNGRSATAINVRLKTLQERLEDLEITEAALQGKLQDYKENEPEAAKVREQIAAAWSQLVDVYGGMAAEVAQAQVIITEAFKKSAPIEAQINALAAKHMQLAGEPLHVYDWSLRAREYSHVLELLTANNNSLEAPLPPWTYVSETQRLEEIAKREAKAKAALEARVKLAIENGPLCQVCKKPMTLRRYLSNDGESIYGSGTWEFEHCFKMKTVNIPETVLESK